MSKPLRIAVIGYGFMGKTHSSAYANVNHYFDDLPFRVERTVLCGRDSAKAQAFANTWGFASVETDWRAVVARDDVDMIDICVPNNLHKEIAIAAAEAGKWVVTEKPLAMDVAEGEAMVAAVEKAGVPNMVWYNYRRVPAVSLAKQLVDEGRLGRAYHYRAQFLQDWTIAPDVPQGGAALWRLDAAAAGSGVTGDLLAHNIDTAMWLNGPITKVMAETETFVKERVHQATGKPQPVGIDDACMFMCRFENGAMGVFESTRYARGHKALKTLEMNGEDASVRFDLHDPQYLEFFEYKAKQSGEKIEGHLTGWRKIHVTNQEHPYMDHWWVPGLTIGYEATFLHALADFLAAAPTGNYTAPTFKDALDTQRVCEAVLRSAGSGNWEATGL